MLPAQTGNHAITHSTSSGARHSIRVVTCACVSPLPGGGAPAAAATGGGGGGGAAAEEKAEEKKEEEEEEEEDDDMGFSLFD